MSAPLVFDRGNLSLRISLIDGLVGVSLYDPDTMQFLATASQSPAECRIGASGDLVVGCVHFGLIPGEVGKVNALLNAANRAEVAP